MQIISFTVKIIDFFYDEQNDVPHRDKDDIWLLIEENIVCIESENDKGIDKKVSLHDLYHQWRCLFPEALILNTAKIRSLDKKSRLNLRSQN